LKPPRERPRGGGGTYRNGGMGASAPIIYLLVIFMGKSVYSDMIVPLAQTLPHWGRGCLRCFRITCPENIYKLCSGNPALAQPGNVIIWRDIYKPIQFKLKL